MPGKYVNRLYRLGELSVVLMVGYYHNPVFSTLPGSQNQPLKHRCTHCLVATQRCRILNSESCKWYRTIYGKGLRNWYLTTLLLVAINVAYTPRQLNNGDSGFARRKYSVAGCCISIAKFQSQATYYPLCCGLYLQKKPMDRINIFVAKQSRCRFGAYHQRLGLQSADASLSVAPAMMPLAPGCSINMIEWEHRKV